MASIKGFSLTDWIPGQGDNDKSQPAPSKGKRWVGNVQLPDTYQLNHAGNGYYDVMNGDKRAGVLRPGGDNGIFDRDSNYVQGLYDQTPQALTPAPGPEVGQTIKLGGVDPGATRSLNVGSNPYSYTPNHFAQQSSPQAPPGLTGNPQPAPQAQKQPMPAPLMNQQGASAAIQPYQPPTQPQQIAPQQTEQMIMANALRMGVNPRSSLARGIK